MTATEIEKKFLIAAIPYDLSKFNCRVIEQGYLCVSPVVRVRRDNDSFYLTYKGDGLMCRTEYNLPLDAESYRHLIAKADGNIITKKRYEIPFTPVFSDPLVKIEQLVIELDVFEGVFAGTVLAEVEFPDQKAADSFIAPDWFGQDVTFSGEYHNSNMSRKVF